ncbi:uncharacterized protein FFUJ_10027 [Fusarium fujikuroi IMI 58289]|uniref:Ubiquitin-like protease family profile domain-containing protein n=1 Tax=Gibberella fujikuroi (strain CBS 195.34 / IMI 58289 / NRRL A-6831) TaxID=1279085 RepID=S0EEU7_GIBF5|nr:uncharacterized protein FFUJ_10027 [Fusarium fujikuroi IMI 58289]CCT73289.1 uncharacterized protein FFUJ_10027 [Fusarium fujikuroi IMI 58289]SCO16539.1 uncharacterized protein FFM5_11302 [Fusarium fujikuroi]
MGNAASSSIKFAIPLFSQTSPDTLLETDDQFYTPRTTMPLLRTQNRGTERPPSESLRTQESLKPDQLVHKCLRQIEDHKELTQDSFDCLIELLRNGSPTGLPIQPSSTVDTKPFDYAISDFVAPLYHHKTGHWTVLCVSSQGPRKEHPGKSVVTAQHYDPDPRQHKGRHTEVGDKIRSWVEQRGSNVELKSTREAGPTIQPSDQNVTGVYTVMGALDFSARKPLRSKDSFWGGDYVKKIKAALHATQPRYPTPGRTPARRGTSISSADKWSRGVQKVWERPSCDEMDIFGNKTPIAGNRKQRRLDPAEHMAFDVNEKLEEATSSILNLGLPSVTNLKQELNERRKERGEHNEVIENKKDDLEKCQTEGASRAREHEEYEKACTELESKLKDDERRVNKWLSEFPQDLNFAIDTEKYKAPGEAT